ncbi:MAG TPA: DUF459 domain-containing protein [Acidimicrobiales bacterium]|nr:DUF459 domain-containing protein [Acidimicrobiales bacterium]
MTRRRGWRWAGALGIVAAFATVAGWQSGVVRVGDTPTTQAASATSTAVPTTTVTATTADTSRGRVSTTKSRGVVLEIGDSLGIDLSWGLSADLAQAGDSFVNETVGDTGLAEPGYFNWPAHLAADLARYHPDVVIVFLGANDVESYYTGGAFEQFGTAAWASVYGERVAEIMESATAAGARVLWVGVPVMSRPTFSNEIARINTVFQAQAAAHPGVVYFPSWGVLAGPERQYEAWAPTPQGGTVVLRDPDGIHLTAGGAGVLAGAVLARLRSLGWLR